MRLVGIELQRLLEVSLGLRPLLRTLEADAAEVVDHPVRLLGLVDRVDALAVDIRAFGELLAPAQDVAERHDCLDIARIGSDQLLEIGLRLVGLVQAVEVERHLDLGIARERRVQRHALIDLVGELRLLHRLVEVAKREQRERMLRHQIERELQIDQPEILAAAAAERGAEPIEHLGRPGLRGIDHDRQLLASVDVVDCLDDQRMARQRLLECREHLQRVSVVALAGEEAAIALHHPQRGGVELVGALEALAGFLLLPGQVEDHGRVQILEDGIPVGAGELVDLVGRGLRLAGARLRPCREQRRRKVGDRAADRLRELAPRGRILLLLDRAHAQHQPSDAVGLVDLQDALGELDRLVNLAVGEHCEEGTAEQFVVARVDAQRGAIVGGGGRGVLLPAGMAGSEVASGGRGASEIRGCFRLGCAHHRPGDGHGHSKAGQCGQGRTLEARRRDHGSSTPSGGRTPLAWPHKQEGAQIGPIRVRPQ